MSYSVKILPGAAKDWSDARALYWDESPALSDAFERSIEVGVRRIVSEPLLYAVREHGCRQCKLHRFPQYLIFYVSGPDVVVVALAHPSRQEGWWLGRT